MIGNVIAGMFSSGAEAGDFQSIATTTLSANQTTVSFTSIPSSFQHLQIRVMAKTSRASASAGAADLTMRFNSDTTTNYNFHRLQGDGATMSSDATTSSSYLLASALVGTDASTTNIFHGAVIDILDYANTNKFKTIRTSFGMVISATQSQVMFCSGAWRKSPIEAISRIDLQATNGTYDLASGSIFALYGIKG